MNIVSIGKDRKPKKYCETCTRKIGAVKGRTKYTKEYWINYLYHNFNKHISDIKINEKTLIIDKYCQHHNSLTINKSSIKSYKQKGLHSICTQCNQIYYINSDLDINSISIQQNWKNIKGLSDTKLLEFNPYIWAFIKKLMNKHRISLAEAKYRINYNINSTPNCRHENCNNNVNFSKDAYGYLLYCKKHLYTHNTSSGELELQNFLKDNKINFEQNNRSIIGKELDVYIPKSNIAIEYNGLYWHSTKFKNKLYHAEKMKNCIDNNIKLITIWEDDWINKQDIIKSIISNQLNLNKNKIFARKTKIKLVSSKNTNLFLDTNHIQGSVYAKINLGLYYNNELVSLMTFGSTRLIMNSISNNEYNYELLRFCNKINTTVIGGASKLFKYFLKNYNPNKITSYVNCDISNGKLYEILKFKKIGYTDINYWWAKNGKKYHRSNFMKHKLVKEGYDHNLTEMEIMHIRGYNKIWGTGNIKYIFE